MTKIGTDRVMAMAVGYEATDWSHPVSFRDYRGALEQWTVLPIERDGETIGALYRFRAELGGPSEVHCSILPQWRRRWATKGLLREIFQGGNIVTRVVAGHEFMLGILGRIGFKPDAAGIQLILRGEPWA